MIKIRDLAVCSVSVLITLATVASMGGELRRAEAIKETSAPVIDYAEPVEAGVNYDVIALQGKKNKVIEVATDHDDIEIIATIVAAEAGNQEMVGKVAVAMVVLNRASIWNKSIYAVATQKNQFAYPYYGKVSDDCYKAVDIAIKNRSLFPENMVYFRTKHYHSFGEPYMQIGDHYFSLEVK